MWTIAGILVGWLLLGCVLVIWRVDLALSAPLGIWEVEMTDARGEAFAAGKLEIEELLDWHLSTEWSAWQRGDGLQASYRARHRLQTVSDEAYVAVHIDCPHLRDHH